MEIRDDGIAVGKGWGDVLHNAAYDYHYGTVVTPHGIVIVYAQGDGNAYNHFSALDFVHGGRWHSRAFDGKRYTPRGLARKAKQFAREIAVCT